MAVARKYNLIVVEDAAQGLDAFYKGRALGSIGHLGAYSFHHTKNQTCGEGGALCINSPELLSRAEIIRDKGTNRSRYLRGEIDKYTWVDSGSSHVPSELSCAFLYAQLEMLGLIRHRREEVFHFYDSNLCRFAAEGLLNLPITPEGCESNYHIYYVMLPDRETRDALMAHLNRCGTAAASHYVPLHSSPMGQTFGYRTGDLPVTEEMSGRLLRLPAYPDLKEREQIQVVKQLSEFFGRSTVTAARSEFELAGA
jgi:dTDP-4-amino-4,6-dideoxygalactose transaminase